MAKAGGSLTHRGSLRGASFALLLLAVSAAGCTYPPSDTPTADLSGAFTADRTDADLEDFRSVLAQHDVDCPLMESFPEQFQCRMPLADCEPLRSELASKEYLRFVSGCARL